MRNAIRWYDQNSRVSYAVNCLKNANLQLRKKLIRLIVKKAMDLSIKIQRPKKSFLNRWYDKDKELNLAMEYFKAANEAQRIVIAEYIIVNLGKHNISLKETDIQSEANNII